MWSKLKKLLQWRVKRWHTAMRGWDDKDIRVLVCLEDQIWYWAVLQWWFWDVMTYVCHWTHFIPLPNFLLDWERNWDKDDPEYRGKWRDWYGESFHGLWHGLICDPPIQWVWDHLNHYEPTWEMTLDEARKCFAHDPSVYVWVEKSLEEHKQYDAEKLAEIRQKYASGELNREQALEKLEWKFEGQNLEELLDGRSGEKLE